MTPPAAQPEYPGSFPGGTMGGNSYRPVEPGKTPATGNTAAPAPVTPSGSYGGAGQSGYPATGGYPGAPAGYGAGANPYPGSGTQGYGTPPPGY